ncbi:hypothetical protein ACHAXR_013212 [Thalassiosira sp. AJA248-18]
MAKSKKNRGKGSSKSSSAAIPHDHSDASKGKKRKRDQLVSSKDQSKSSLARQLKKHRGIAAKTAPPPIWKDKSGRQRNFLTPQDDPLSFDDCLKTSFSGFHYDSPDLLPSRLHGEFDSSFGGMEQGGLFLYDTVQPGKKRLTRTSVTRTLVGDPGSTYKYLGLRLFSHPWVNVDKDGNAMSIESNDGSTLRKLGYSKKTASALMTMGNINSQLTERSSSMLHKHVSPNVCPVGMVGSAEFNLTLVNKMEPTATKRDLKKDISYGMGKISVGWHRDSCLKDFSTIAVYQTLKEPPLSKSNDSWGVALRAMDGGAGGPLESIPPLMIPLPSGSLYYMLDDFNHNHEHAVIAGSGGIRYSSTHRVAREGQGTWQYIRDKINMFLSSAATFDMSKGICGVPDELSPRKKREKLVSHLRAQQKLMTEIEFEWLRQWYVQGQKHASLHPYWHKPIRMLCESFCKLEKATSEITSLLEVSSKDGQGEHVTEDLYDVLIEALSERSKLRSSWKGRYQDPIFGDIPVDERPFPCACLDREEVVEGQLPENLDLLVSQLRQWRSAFVATEEIEELNEVGVKKAKKSKKSKSGSLTKKESKQRASNWERLKANLKG